MNGFTKSFLLVTFLIVTGVAGYQVYGKYAVRACVDITELMATDNRQCFSGSYKGIVGIDLKVMPIAYRIARHKSRFRSHIKRWHHHNIARELVGSEEEGKFHESLKDPELASIAYELEQYSQALKKAPVGLQSYDDSAQKAPQQKEKIVIKDYGE